MDEYFDINEPGDMELLGGTTDDEEVAGEDELKTGDAAESVDEKDQEGSSVEKDVESTDAEDKQDEEKPARDPFVSRSRFDEVHGKYKAEKEEVERLRAELEAARTQPQQPAKQQSDIAAMEKEYGELFGNGDWDQAAELRVKINNEIFAQAEAIAARRIEETLNTRDANKSFADAVQESMTAYPFLDINSEGANNQAIGEVVEWRDFYISKGDQPAAALRKAVGKIAPMYSVAQEPAKGAKDMIVDPRKDKATQAAIAAANAQPPKIDAGVGNRVSPKGNAITNDQDKWDKASDEERLQYLM